MVGRIARGGCAHPRGGFLEPAATQQHLGSVERRAGVVWHQFDGSHGMSERPVQITRLGQRAAQMAMPLGPVRRLDQEPLIGGGGLAMFAAIAEQPGADMRGVAVARRQQKRAPAAFERIVAPAVVEQRFREPAIQ